MDVDILLLITQKMPILFCLLSLVGNYKVTL